MGMDRERLPRESPAAVTPLATTPITMTVVPAQPPPIPVRPASIAYGTRETDLTRDCHSLDREMAARLCRTVGIGLTGFGAVLLLMLCAGGPVATRAGGGAVS